MIERLLRSYTAVLILTAWSVGLQAQDLPEPREYFGFEIGADRSLADWEQLTGWYELLAERSPRVVLDTLGLSTLGRPFVMLTVTSAANHARLAELQGIQLRLADPRRVSGPEERARLLEQGRTVVLVTHGIHATEVGGPQMAARLLHRLATSEEPQAREILDNVILLDIPSLNPDGLDMVVQWYRRWVGTPHEGAPLPWLYHFYVGHDNNRDWYAFTQRETELTVTKAHNAWHPQIVHDIHQMGSSGARIFFPPYVEPWEENVDPALTAAASQLGAYMAAELIAQGKRGVVINAQYDAYTPARAYQHYHGGVRILSETASARIATPIVVAPEDLRSGRGFDASTRSWNFPSVWEGGEWGLPDIVDYMDAGVMALLTNAATQRRYWLENFYRINERAVEGWRAWPAAWVLPGDQEGTGLDAVLRILTLGDVEVHRAKVSFSAEGHAFPEGSFVIPLRQPYASFAHTLLSRQVYPDLRQYPGGPPRPPYDVTAHTLPLLMDVEAISLGDMPDVPLSDPIPAHQVEYRGPPALLTRRATDIALYKSWDEPMTEGWTRWMFDRHAIPYDTLHDADIRGGALERYRVLIFEDQDAEDIVGGWSYERMPLRYAGGVGSEGVEAVRRFVERGGRIIAIGDATQFVIETFGLLLDDPVDGLTSGEFYVPGSLLRLTLDSGHPIARGVGQEAAAWYWRGSRAFDVRESGATVVARYGEGDPLLSGWALGHERIAGRPAIVELEVGEGSVVLFGFPPNYRGQTIATWPLLFNAMIGGSRE
jgi:hypothetical protein